MSLIIPQDYRNILGNVETTEKAIKALKDMFQANLSAQLALLRVTAPMVVLSGTGMNDDLNGVENPVSFEVKGVGGSKAEVVHSLAEGFRFPPLSVLPYLLALGLNVLQHVCEERLASSLTLRASNSVANSVLLFLLA